MKARKTASFPLATLSVTASHRGFLSANPEKRLCDVVGGEPILRECREGPRHSRPAGLRGRAHVRGSTGGAGHGHEMSNTSLPTEEKEQEEEKAEAEIGAAQSPPLPDEGCVPPAEAPMPSEGEPGPAPHVHCQTWLLDKLDDVRYLISCTNWY